MRSFLQEIGWAVVWTLETWFHPDILEFQNGMDSLDDGVWMDGYIHPDPGGLPSLILKISHGHLWLSSLQEQLF